MKDLAERARQYARQLAAKDARIADLEAQNDRLAAMLLAPGGGEVAPGVVVIPEIQRA